MSDEPTSSLECDYETYVWRNAETVSIERMLEFLGDECGRIQYEAAAGAATLASYRPDRLRPYVDELEARLGTLESEVDLETGTSADSAVGDANACLADAIGAVLGENAELLPAAIDRVDTASGAGRKYAALVLASAASTRPGGETCGEHVEAFEAMLDEPDVRPQAVDSLAGIAARRPDSVEHLLPRMLESIDPDASHCGPAYFVLVLAAERPDAFEPHWSALRTRVRECGPHDACTVAILAAIDELAGTHADELHPLADHVRTLAETATGSTAALSRSILETLEE